MAALALPHPTRYRPLAVPGDDRLLQRVPIAVGLGDAQQAEPQVPVRPALAGVLSPRLGPEGRRPPRTHDQPEMLDRGPVARWWRHSSASAWPAGVSA
jgi:hypothetical protein